MLLSVILKIMSTNKIILAAIISTGFLFSCSKVDIQPNTQNSENTDETLVNRSGVVTDAHESGTHKSIIAHGGTREIISGITDPNNDEDRNKRKKGKSL